MKWQLMSAEDLHAFGFDLIVPYLKKKGGTIKAVHREVMLNPQIMEK